MADGKEVATSIDNAFLEGVANVIDPACKMQKPLSICLWSMPIMRSAKGL